MRKLLPAVLLLPVAVAVSVRAHAQITLVPGPAVDTPRQPTFVAAADFNRDGFQDAAFTSPAASQVVVVFGDAGGLFQTKITFEISRRAEAIATGDLNGDGYADIAVVGNIGNSVFVGYYEPATQSFSVGQPVETGRRPVDVTVGNFDKRNGLDLATAGVNIDKVTVLTHKGSNLQFESKGDFAVGTRPEKLKAADFNLDGVDDIVALNSGVGNPGANNAAVILNQGSGTMTSPTSYVVGTKSASLEVADINRDGAPDILVLNAGPISGFNTYSVSVLINNGRGIFQTLPAVVLNCPAKLGGIPIFCTPQVVTAADFDQDGYVDFAVSFSTAPQSDFDSPTPGIIEAFAGAGDGTFVFATLVNVGRRPRGIAAGDYNGDGYPDLAVAESGDSKVRIVLTQPPPKRNEGLPCNVGTQCASAFCVDGYCCGVSQCPAGQLCSIPGSEGTCAAPVDNGFACTAGNQCNSGNCVGGFCCGSAACPAGQFCNTGACGGPAPNGARCGTDEQCASGNCVDGFCCASHVCPAGARCDVPGSQGACVPPQPLGDPCTSPLQCESGFCVDGSCCIESSCPAGQSCSVSGHAGACVALPTATPTPTATSTPTHTPTPQPLGATCSSGNQCVSGACVDGVCCASTSCPVGQSCNVFGSSGSCAPQRPDGQECRSDDDCLSGNCQPGTPPVCAPARTATPTVTATRTPTPTPLANGQFCIGDTDCQSGFCTDGFCCEAASCPEGQACNIEGREGQCSAPKPSGGQSCNPSESSPCAGGLFCNPDGVCCQSASCPEGQRCDVTGKEGRCASPSGTGAACSKNSDCQSGLECRLDGATETFRCLPPRTPTPTLIPPPTPTRVAGGTTVTSTRGGGCSIGDSGSDGNGAWLLAAVPLALGIRRRALTSVRGRQE